MKKKGTLKMVNMIVGVRSVGRSISKTAKQLVIFTTSQLSLDFPEAGIKHRKYPLRGNCAENALLLDILFLRCIQENGQ